MKKATVKVFHDKQYYIDHETNDNNSKQLLKELGGIDRVLNFCLDPKNEFIIGQSQLNRIHQIISNGNAIDRIYQTTSNESSSTKNKTNKSSTESLTRNRNNDKSDDKYIPNSQLTNNIDDLSQLLHFNTENILNNMKTRFCNKSTNARFTSIKDLNVLLSINPYTKSPNNSHNKIIQQFNDSSSTTAAKY
eukprot:100792_1